MDEIAARGGQEDIAKETADSSNSSNSSNSGNSSNSSNSVFQLPITFLRRKMILEEHTVNDLELLPPDSTDSLYKYVLKPTTVMGQQNINLWSKYYTSDTVFLKESQKLLKHKLPLQGIAAETQVKVSDIWNEIRTETGFHEKYSYIEWERLQMLNNSSKFLQCLSIYNMASPIFSLMLPIFLMIIPLFIIKLRGIPITIDKYIELLKSVCKKHQLGQLFDLSNASFEKIIYVLGSAAFYILQIYQNIMACRKFYCNIAKIHEQLFVMRDYLQETLNNMDSLAKQCDGLTSYSPFIETMQEHRMVYEHVLHEFNQVSKNTLSISKFGQIGHVMKCFYKLYKNKELHISLNYSFGFNGYVDNLNGIRQNMKFKHISACKFKSIKNKNNKNNKNKSSNKNNKPKFVDAYFPPTLVNGTPVKNTYSLDKHLLITGPNAAGKTTLLKTTIFNIILSQQIGFGFYKKASFVPYDMIHCYINIPDTSARDSLFQAEAKRCKDILDKIGEGIEDRSNKGGVGGIPPQLLEGGVGGVPPQRHFCVFDELYSGTNPYEAIGSAYAFLTFLNKNDNVNFVLTTHFLELCKRLEKQRNMHNYHMKIETQDDDFKYTYKMAKGISTIKGGVKVLKDLDYPQEIINTTINTLKELEI